MSLAARARRVRPRRRPTGGVGPWHRQDSETRTVTCGVAAAAGGAGAAGPVRLESPGLPPCPGPVPRRDRGSQAPTRA